MQSCEKKPSFEKRRNDLAPGSSVAIAKENGKRLDGRCGITQREKQQMTEVTELTGSPGQKKGNRGGGRSGGEEERTPRGSGSHYACY